MSYKKKVVIAGGTGFVGQELGLALVKQGYEVVVLTRDPEKAKNSLPFPCKLVEFSRNNLLQLAQSCDGAKAIVNLAGQPVNTGKWTLSGKDSVYASRLESARLIGEIVSSLHQRPEVLVQASATGIYPADGLVWNDADPVPPIDSYLATVCRHLETAVGEQAALGSRCCYMRFGVILGQGGAFAEIAKLYGSGIGSRFTNGKNYSFPWVHIVDAVRATILAIETPGLRGPINVVANESSSLSDLDAAMRTHFGIQFTPTIPAAIVSIVASKRAALLFKNPWVRPDKLVNENMQFQYHSLQKAIDDLTASAPAHNRLVKRQFVAADTESVWRFFSNPENLEQITPEWLNFRIDSLSTKEMGDGTEISYKLKIKGVLVTWRSVILKWNEGVSFTDVQLTGPYKNWHHSHHFEKLADGVLITDDISYRLPFGKAGALAAGWLVRKDVEQIFSHRARVIGRIFDGFKRNKSNQGEKNEVSDFRRSAYCCTFS